MHVTAAELTCLHGLQWGSSAGEADASTTYVYDTFGQLAMEAGGAEAPSCATCFLTMDALGSTRQVTDAATGGTVENHDYLPFAEELTGVGGRTGAGWGVNDITLKFTGKERDTDTAGSGNVAGLDYFGARYFSEEQWRFASPDQPLADQETNDPQSWNLYVYTRNNPLHFIDPTGRGCTVSENSYTDNTDLGPDCQTVLKGDGNAQQVEVTSKPMTSEELRTFVFGPPLLPESWMRALFGPPGVKMGMITIGPSSNWSPTCFRRGGDSYRARGQSFRGSY